MSNAKWAYGSILQLGNSDGTAFADVAEILELGLPKRSRDAIEVTNHDSEDGYYEGIPGMRDGGEVPFKANYLPTNTTQDETTGLLFSFNSDNVAYWRIVVPAFNLTFPFRGFLTAHEPDLPLKEQAQLSGTIKVTGKPGTPF
jgi:predicted secreted protein